MTFGRRDTRCGAGADEGRADEERGRGAREEGSAYSTALHYIWQRRVRIEDRGERRGTARAGEGKERREGCR